MLVCHQCQAENPDVYNFCQSCGAPLSERECSICDPECDPETTFNSESCLQCESVTGTTWKAILSPVGPAARPTKATDLSDSATIKTAVSLPSGKFLDARQRYQLLEPLPQQMGTTTEVEVRVQDRQSPAASAPDLPHLPPPSPLATPPIAGGKLPDVAQPYLILQEQFPLLPLPSLHAAWQQNGLNVLLLEDRSNLPLLVELWGDPYVLPLQILHWVHEMTELWAALETQHCCRSLLELENLRIDEDCLVCLQRLYPDSPQQPSRLSQMGQVWQTLFRQSQRTQNSELALLCDELDAGTITTVNQLQARIEAIAIALQSSPDGVISGSTIPNSTEVGSTEVSPAVGSVSTPLQPPEHLPEPSLSTSSSTEITQDLPKKPAPPSNIQPPQPNVQPVAKAIPAPAAPIEVSGEASVEASAITAPPGTSMELEETPTGWPDLEDEEEAGETDDLPTVVLAMKLVSLEDAGRTDIGRQRDHNEDCFSIQTETKKVEDPQGRAFQAKGLYILCDGMGGHASGEVASALAVETLQQYFDEHWQDKLPNEESIREAICKANRALFDLNQKNASAGSGRMGTTLVLLLIQDAEAAIAHVGDSRLYRLSRRRGLQQLTTDHEVGQREIQRGVEPSIAYARPDAYQLTQALGPRDENFLSPDVKFIELNEDGILLLCSDGLSDNDLLETNWQTHLEPMLDHQTNLEQGVNQLIDLANRHNGHDNITAVAVRLKVRPNLDQISR